MAKKQLVKLTSGRVLVWLLCFSLSGSTYVCVCPLSVHVSGGNVELRGEAAGHCDIHTNSSGSFSNEDGCLNVLQDISYALSFLY